MDNKISPTVAATRAVELAAQIREAASQKKCSATELAALALAVEQLAVCTRDLCQIAETQLQYVLPTKLTTDDVIGQKGPLSA